MTECDEKCPDAWSVVYSKSDRDCNGFPSWQMQICDGYPATERCLRIIRQQIYNICLELSQFFPYSPYIVHITFDALNLTFSERGVHNGKTSDTLSEVISSTPGYPEGFPVPSGFSAWNLSKLYCKYKSVTWPLRLRREHGHTEQRSKLMRSHQQCDICRVLKL
jgi:hypothetical protein